MNNFTKIGLLFSFLFLFGCKERKYLEGRDEISIANDVVHICDKYIEIYLPPLKECKDER